jgi:hypothetical protein
MVDGERSLEDLRRLLLSGEIDRDEFLEAVNESDETAGRDDLWARWASQGLMDDPIRQRGYLSLKGGVPRQVEGDG